MSAADGGDPPAGAGARMARVEELFAQALARPAAARAGFLAEACGADAELHREVASLVEHAAPGETGLHRAIAAVADDLTGEAARAIVGQRIGPYRVLGVIGEGGMGAVYRATRDDQEYRREVAIKVLRAGPATPEAIARLRDERQVLAALEHPGIVHLLDGGRTDGGLPYLVMELIDGTPLAVHARELDVRARVALVIRIGEAVQHAHQHLVVHRDLKPSNVIVDRAGAPRLLDFGIAKLLDPSASREAATRTGMGAFTIEYASPEQVRGEPVSVATDVYSLGAVLYELLVGAPPQRAGDTMRETLEQVCDRPPVRPSVAAPAAVRRELAGDLDNIVLKALQKRPADRYPSVAALVDDLRRHLAGLPVGAREATVRYRARKLIARHRGKLALAAAIVAALATATVMSIAQARRADRNARRADRERLTMLVERGRQELIGGRGGRALPFLAEALRGGADSPAVRLLIAAAMRPYAGRIARVDPEGGIADAAWSPDGRRLAITSLAGGGRLVDADGALIARFAASAAAEVRFSPDGGALAVAGADGAVAILDGRDATARRTLPAAAGGEVRIAFVDGSLLAAAADGRLARWDLATGARLAAGDLACQVRSLRAAPGWTRAVVGCDGTTARVVDVATLAEARRLAVAEFPGSSPVSDFDGAHVIGSTREGQIELWDAADGRLLGRVGGSFASLSADGTTLLVSGPDDSLRLHDTSTLAFRRALPGPEGGLFQVAWARGGRRLAVVGHDASSRVWDLADGVAIWSGELGIRLLTQTRYPIASFSPDDARLFVATSREAAIWRADAGARLAERDTGDFLHAALWSPDERSVATTGWGGTVVWRDGAPVARWPVVGASQQWDLDWSPDGALLATTDATKVELLDVAGGRRRPLAPHPAAVYQVRFSPDGGTLATAAVDGDVRLWDPRTGELRRVVHHGGHVSSVAWSADGRELVTAGRDHHIRIWRADTGAMRGDLDGGQVEYMDARPSPDGRSIAAAGRGGEAEVWDVASRRRRLVLEGHSLWLFAAAWSPDGALIATSSGDRTVRVWDARTGGLLAQLVQPHEVTSVAWDRAGARLLTAGLEGRYRVWDVGRFSGTAGELDRFIGERLPYRLVAGRLEHAE